MKKNIKWGIMCGISGIVIGSALTVSAGTWVEAFRNDQIKVTLDGVEQTFRDATTNEVELPLTYNDRTYLPMRSLANLVGVDVEFDATTNTAALRSKDFLNQATQSFEKIDYSNRLEDGLYGSDTGYVLAQDGSTLEIKGGDREKIFSTNLPNDVKSFRCTLEDGITFWVLTESGAVYQAHVAMEYDPNDMNIPFDRVGDEYEKYDEIGKTLSKSTVDEKLVARRTYSDGQSVSLTYKLLSELEISSMEVKHK